MILFGFCIPGGGKLWLVCLSRPGHGGQAAIFRGWEKCDVEMQMEERPLFPLFTDAILNFTLYFTVSGRPIEEFKSPCRCSVGANA